MIEEFVIWSRKREFVADEALLTELRAKGFEPQVVGEIDPPPRNGGSWVLRDKRDRRSHEDGGVWVSWSRPRGADGRRDFSVRYVVETFDGRSGYDWFLSLAVASGIANASRGLVSPDGAPEKDAPAFVAELGKDPTTAFHGPESVVDWESQNLDAAVQEDDEADDEDEDEYDEEDDDGEEEDDEEDDDEDDGEEEDGEEEDADDDGE